MRVLFTSFALDAHYLGSVPLAWALRAAGHEVRVASQPALTDTITSAGLTAVPVGEDHTLLGAMSGFEVDGAADTPWNAIDLDPTRPEVQSPAFLRALNELLPSKFFAHANNDSMIDDLVRFARHWRPDLVIWEPFTFAGAIAAKAVGAAHARLLWGADLFLNQRLTYLRLLGNEPDPLAEWLGGVLDRHGLLFDEATVRGQWTIDQMPAGIRLPLGEHTVPMRYVPYNGPAVVPDWLREPPTRPRVCLTVGLTARDGADYLVGSLDGMFDAVGDLDVEIVATLNADQRARISRLPANVHAVDFVPLHALLPTCSAIAHHGGAGTWSTAAVSGTPQLIFPSVWDNSYRARRTAEVGAGLLIPADELTPEALRDGLRRLLDEPRFAEGADRLRAEMTNDPSPGDVVPVLEKLTARHQSYDA
ncbi:activator-dependent family glycosyltransferase [Actinokineospora xionganensis]|uniref:Activator-dependent family glycosyltransferase n=1 Tax=Actinokineospora xionganensis TaxID=2684470 RepID=A0ABR7L9R8_9PSEU|nr:activator-dependent family glycosyltransferase [Actinokineospora xionganensis]MBC6449047.1 activator-dependent family glycosyltransferase [Actinokineospora xionganensis]